MSDHAQVPDGFDLKAWFSEIKTIAVVGYSDNPERAGHYVSHHMADAGYEVISVNPRFGEEVNGLKSFKSLDAIPAGMKIDVIDCFRSPKFMPDVVKAAALMNPKPGYIVMQPGAESEEAAELARENGMVPLNLCLMAAHRIWSV